MDWRFFFWYLALCGLAYLIAASVGYDLDGRSMLVGIVVLITADLLSKD